MGEVVDPFELRLNFVGVFQSLTPAKSSISEATKLAFQNVEDREIIVQCLVESVQEEVFFFFTYLFLSFIILFYFIYLYLFLKKVNYSKFQKKRKILIFFCLERTLSCSLVFH